MQHRNVVTSFLKRRGKLLLLRRSAQVRTYQGKWAAVSGSMNSGPPLAQAYAEIQEETGLASQAVTLRASGSPFKVESPEIDTVWTVHPFLFDVANGARVRLNWEHDEARWDRPQALQRLETVPQLLEAWQCVALEERVLAFIGNQESGATTLSREALHILASASRAGMNAREVQSLGERLTAGKTAMAAVKNLIGHVQRLGEAEEELPPHTACEKTLRWAQRASRRTAQRAAQALPQNATILTCSFSSTVVNVFKRARSLGKHPSVIALESRVGRWSYGEKLSDVLTRAGIRCDVLADSAVAKAVARASLAMVGADRILRDGSFINGTPTLAMAEACRGMLPLLVVAETFKLDNDAALAPGFDFVRPDLADSYCTERGRIAPQQISRLFPG